MLDQADVPVLQVVQAQSSAEAWTSSPRGLSPTDLAMNVVLPELDGRLLARTIAFKDEAPLDERLQFGAVRHVPAAGPHCVCRATRRALGAAARDPECEAPPRCDAVGLSGPRRTARLRGRSRHGAERGRDRAIAGGAGL